MELKLTCSLGKIEYHADEPALLENLNAHSNNFEIRVIDGQRWAWHKGHNRKVGLIEMIEKRAAA